MNKLQLYLIRFFFRAFLPQKESGNGDEEGTTFYSALGVSTKATADDIREAYKKKSLQHHPDKVAQFARSQDKTPEQIQEDFVKIKEAYETLSDQSRRDAYDVLGEEGGKMVTSFVESKNDKSGTSGGFELHKLVFNLAEASITDKCKLFSMVTLAVSFLLVGPILICAKVDATLSSTELNTNFFANVRWVTLLTPIWILHGLTLLLVLLGQAWFETIKMLCIVALEILLALKWDGTIDAKYELILIPLYLHQVFHLIESIAIMLKVERDVARMVTMSYLERHIIPVFHPNDAENGDGEVTAQRSYEDLTEEECEEINQAYIIITEVPHDPMEELEDNDEESLNSIQAEVKLTHAIASSPEFQHASRIESFAKKSMRSCIMFRLPFLVLLVLQLDGDRGWNWNIVFTPIWIETLFHLLSSCWTACCGNAHLGRNEEKMEIIEINMDFDNETSVNDIEANQENKTLLPILVDGGNLYESIKPDIEEVDSGDNPVTLSANKSIKVKVENTIPEISKLAGLEESNPDMPSDPVLNNSSPNNGDVNDDGDASDQYDNMGNTDSQLAEEHAGALSSCGYYMYLVIGLSLFVVKLNRATDMDESIGYSSYWVLFPLYFSAATMLMMFGCCIFATPANMMETGNDSQENQGVDIDAEINEDSVNKSIAVGEQDEETGKIAIETPCSDQVLTGEDKVKKEETHIQIDMDDLD